MPSGYYQNPTIHNEKVVFVCEDDLWTVTATGGIARRLTSNLGEANWPCFSPDGQYLAFVGREEGSLEIYLMPALGGQAKRLTYMSGSTCQTAAWTPDGKIVFANSAEHYYFRFTQLYTMEIDGIAPTRLDYGLARMIAYGPDGGVLIGRNTIDPARWKRYQGGRRGLIWVKESNGEPFHPLIKLEGNMSSPMWITSGEEPQGRIYFICDHEGIGNLYSCLPSGEGLRRHSDHATFYTRNASTDGRRIVYHSGADLYLFDPSADETVKIPVDLHSPQVQRNRKFVDSGKYLESWELHPSGQAVVISTRGKVFSFANWEGAVIGCDAAITEKDNSTSEETLTSVRYRLPRWLNDGKRVVAVADAGGEETFVILHADGSQAPVFLPEMDIGRPGSVTVNPKKDQIVFSNHRYEIIFLDLENYKLRVIDRGKASPIRGFDWSPDGRWIAYSVSVSLQVSALKLWHADSGEITPLTQPLLRDVFPRFDPRSRYLYFLSYRQFDPVRDNVHLDFNFPRGMLPYLITLQKDLPSPFILKSKVDVKNDKEEEVKNGGTEEEYNAVKNDTQRSEDTQADQKSEETPLQIDLEDIEKRIIAFPVIDGRYRRVYGAKDGKVLYSRYPIEGELNQPWSQQKPPAKGTLLVYNFETQKEETLIAGITDFKLTPDGAMLIYRAGNNLRVFKAGEKPDEKNNHRPRRKSGWLNLKRVKVSIDPGAEWRQMYREAWRLQRDQFWTANMSGVDWVAVHDRYIPLVERVSSRSEFSDLMWEMQGELGTSHCYEMGGDYRPAPYYAQGFLGADFVYEPAVNGWRITNIIQGDVWNPEACSPLNTPGANIKPGDILTAINGVRLNGDHPPAAYLVNQADSEITLTVLQEGEEKTRTVTVKTLKSETQARYREWVEANRQQVHAATDGHVGYIHIPDMGAWGFSEFHRGYLAEVERPGLIVDIRFNRGGYISALLLEKLARRRLGYDNSRWSPLAVPYPEESPSGPMVAICNEFSASDGDIFSHAFKMLGLGTLIGTRTWGGVVGIEPRHWLVDGTVTTQPEFSFWFSDVGWGVENYGTVPDIEVEITPEDYARGTDTQLERAIDEIMRILAENPQEHPAFEDRPNLALPKLPKRDTK